jgi:hypothetical protein
MIARKKWYFLTIFLCLFFSIKSSAMSNMLRLPIATIEGAAATACLLTAATCLRSCLDTKLKPVPLMADSATFVSLHNSKDQFRFMVNAIWNDVKRTCCRTAELVALKTAMLGVSTLTGFCGLYLAFCSLRTLTR